MPGELICSPLKHALYNERNLKTSFYEDCSIEACSEFGESDAPQDSLHQGRCGSGSLQSR